MSHIATHSASEGIATASQRLAAGGVCPPPSLPGRAVTGMILVLLLPVLAATGLLLAGGDVTAGAPPLTDPYIWHVVRFTLLQAALSTLFSVILGIWMGHALFRQGNRKGVKQLARLLLLPFALPQLVAVLGLLAVWGRQGWIAALLHALGWERGPDIYGLPGILLAHVFYNAPLVARLVHLRLSAMPAEYLRIANQLGMPPGALWRLVTWPLVRGILPGAALLVFMLCASSFTVVLVLGGGPGATTLEVAIYQSLRFDFAPDRALVLSALQLALAGGLFLLLRRLAGLPDVTASLAVQAMPHPYARHRVARVLDGLGILALLLLLSLPLAGIVQAGLAADLGRLIGESAFRQALLTSLAVAATAAAIALGMALLLLAAFEAPRGALRRDGWTRAADALSSLVLMISPVVLAAGGFVLLVRTGGPAAVSALAFPFVAGINALMALPFVWRALAPAWRDLRQRHGRLCAQLNLRGWWRWRLVLLPLLAPALGPALATALALSLGDLGAVALLGSEDFRTLPLLIYQRLGSYRTADAAGLSLLLLVVVAVLMMTAEHLIRKGNTRL